MFYLRYGSLDLKSNVTSAIGFTIISYMQAIVRRTFLMSTKHKESLFKVKVAKFILHRIFKVQVFA